MRTGILVVLFFVLSLFLSLLTSAQENTPVTLISDNGFSYEPIQTTINGLGTISCEQYFAKLESQIDLLGYRLSLFVRAPSSMRSDYNAFMEKRLEWQQTTPPDCAIELHNNVIAMYANLGDIFVWGLWLELDPESISGNRLVQEAIDRANLSVINMAQIVSAYTGNEINTTEVTDSLKHISDRFEED